MHHDQLHAQHADGVVVDVVRVGGNDGFVLQSGEVGQPLHALRIAAGDGRRGEVRDRGAAAGGDDAPLGAGDFGQALADAVHQLVHVDEAARGLIHGALDFGQRLRAGDDRERAAGVDDAAARRSIDRAGRANSSGAPRELPSERLRAAASRLPLRNRSRRALDFNLFQIIDYFS